MTPRLGSAREISSVTRRLSAAAAAAAADLGVGPEPEQAGVGQGLPHATVEESLAVDLEGALGWQVAQQEGSGRCCAALTCSGVSSIGEVRPMDHLP